MSEDKPKSRYVGTKIADDHMTVKHIQRGLTTAGAQKQQQPTQQRQMTTAHLTSGLSQANKPQISAEKPAQSVPNSPAPKSSGK